MEGFKNFNVVINDNKQYSIWPEELVIPNGWYKDGFSGIKEECLQYIKEVWTDLNPNEVR